MDKEQIIIDGVFINACLVPEKCKEFETCKIKNILRQFSRKTQECEELKKKIETYKCSTNCHKYIEASRYRKALEEIEEIALRQKERIEFLSHGYNNDPIMIDILDIISKAKGIKQWV